MIQNFVGVVSLLWVKDKQISDKVFGLLADRPPGLLIKRVIASFYLLKQLLSVIVVEWRIAA
jgi:hypothetical protein